MRVLAAWPIRPNDRSKEGREKQYLREHWGDWSTLACELSPSPRRSVAAYLASRLNDYRGAIARIPADLRSLYINAYQSFLWNEILLELIRQRCEPSQFVELDLNSPAGRLLQRPHRQAARVLEFLRHSITFSSNAF